MTEWLYKKDIACARGVLVDTVSRNLARSRARVKARLPLRPDDLPLNDSVVLVEGTERPVWDPDGPIREYLASNPSPRRKRPAGARSAQPSEEKT